ncbi:exodeoxyribonuclease VIII [Entomomonas moraniae]|uniref:Exodeoxyribonuclease VIII n=1 Tax=Entomomonas moraniae TaxID=2213226 RepID=A0A3S9XA34_9GAMM|nr:PD-(D/E)XK nuclease-like domain-containing protein [Entomomonas moraniae]AZS49312.1 exodeoxyribonuclease VIII [Entomomonas moraniae]
MQAGYYKDISNTDYHASEGISKSGLDLIDQSPALYLWSKNAPYDEDNRKALDIGTAFHTLILEPDTFNDRFAVSPENSPRNTIKGKEAWADFESQLNGRIPITKEDYKKLFLMRDSALAHPHIKWLIEANGEVETSIYWNEETTGELAKCRPDKLLIDSSCLVDIKTTSELNRINKSFIEYRYHVQDAWYSAGFKAHFSESLTRFLFVVVSTSLNCGRYPVRIFELPIEAKTQGEQIYLENISTFSECKRTGNWGAIETLNLNLE